MSGKHIALALIIFLSTVQCQEYNNLDSPLNVALEDLECNETVRMAQFGSEKIEAARFDTFKVDIINSGTELITNISVIAILPKGMKYKDSSYLGGSTLEEILEPNQFDEAKNTRIKWKIWNLNSKENKSILFRTYVRCSVKETKIKLGALGYKSNSPINVIEDVSIVLRECNCSDDKDIFESPLLISSSTLNNTNCNLIEESVSGNGRNVRRDAFKINLQNVGEKSIDNLTILAVIPQGMKYINSSYFYEDDTDLKVKLNPEKFDEMQKTKIRWNFDRLTAYETKSIVLDTSIGCPVNEIQIELAASGYVGRVFVNTTTKSETIVLEKCNCTNADLDTPQMKGNIYIGVRVYNPNENIKNTLSGKNIIYNISVINPGELRLENIAIVLELPKGMHFNNTSYFDQWRGELLDVSQIGTSDDRQKTKLILNIGDLLPGENKSIILQTHLKYGFDDADIFAMAQGYLADSQKNEPIIAFAGTALSACNLIDEYGLPCNRAICGLNCTEVCDEWVNRFLEPSSRSINVSPMINGITLNSTVYEANNSTRSVFGFGNSEAASFNIYNITVKNNQTVLLSDLNLNVIFPKGIMIKNTINSDKVEPRIDPIIFNKYSETSISWTIPTLMKDETKWFIVETFLNKDMNINNTNIKVNVTGYAPDYDCAQVTASTDKAIPIKCLQINRSGDQCSEADVQSDNCTIFCPDWAIK